MSVLLGLLFALTGIAGSWHKEKNEKEEIKVKLEQIQKQYEQLKISKTAASPKKVAATTTSKPPIKQAVVIPVGKQVIADYIKTTFGSRANEALTTVKCESNFRMEARGAEGEIGAWQFKWGTFYGNANYYFPNQNLSIYNYKHQTLVAKKMWDNQQEYQWTCWRTNFL